jgi:hypothetical protein
VARNLDGSEKTDGQTNAEAGEAERDPDRHVLTTLGTRASHVAAEQVPKTKRAAEAALYVVEIRGIEPNPRKPR